METPKTKKTSDFFKNALNKAGEASKKALDVVKAKSQEVADQAQVKSYEARLKKYNPLFPDEFHSAEYRMPLLIQIADPESRRDIDVCEGAIGWMSEEQDMRVLHIYNTALDECNVTFFPSPQCDNFYYVDPHNSSLYINVESYFSNMQEEKLAELQQIADSLGARQYWVEVVADTKESSSSHKEGSFNIKKVASGKVSETQSSSSATSSKGIAGATFSGTREPSEPRLCWYANDRNILNLIRMRCDGTGVGITDYTLELSNSNSATMSISTAAKIDTTIAKLGASCNLSNKGKEEHSQKMYFKLLF